MLATVSLFTGMRLGEVLALRRSRVELDTKFIQVREALEETAEHGIRFKAPKSKAGRRDITLPDILVNALRDHRKDGKVVKEGDDLMCATRYALMMLRLASTARSYQNFRRKLVYPKSSVA